MGRISRGPVVLLLCDVNQQKCYHLGLETTCQPLVVDTEPALKQLALGIYAPVSPIREFVTKWFKNLKLL